ncbi:MAG: hypothetical protein ACRD6X_01025 [Pyrinomonadaceae bacterium]
MKFFWIVCLFALFAGCGEAPSGTGSTGSNENRASVGLSLNETSVDERHANSEIKSISDAANNWANSTPRELESAEFVARRKARFTESGVAIDTTAFDERILAIKKDLNLKLPSDEEKAELAEAFYKRALALIDAHQYGAALADCRAAQRIFSEHEMSRRKIDQLIRTYKALKLEEPMEGQEPTPLPMPAPTK